jgi:flagellar biosynthesis/type III secretory pathway chaperone
VEALAKNFGKPYHSKLSELLEYVPDVTQPMFESIIDEINNLITKVRRKVEQNQRLLTRLCDVTDQVLQATSPASHSKTYSATGKVGRLSNSGSSLNHRV